MAEPNTIISIVASSIIASLRLAEFGLHFKEVSSETRTFLINIQLVHQNIQTARRLLNTKYTYLDPHTKADAEYNIKKAEEVLQSIGETIEKCRVDLDIKGSVGVTNRLRWLLRDHRAFLDKERVLSMSLQSLISCATQMSLAKAPDNPPSYNESMPFRGPLRGPSTRRKLVKTMEEEEKELYGETDHVRFKDPSGTSTWGDSVTFSRSSTWSDAEVEEDDNERWALSSYGPSETFSRTSSTPSDPFSRASHTQFASATQKSSYATSESNRWEPPEPDKTEGLELKKRRRCSAIR